METRVACLAGWVVLVLMLAVGGPAQAVPQQIDYQGKLTDPTGNPINGSTSMVFRIWTHATAGSVVWVETQAVVQVESGLFHVNLGAVRGIPEGLFDQDGLYLSIQVGTDAQMTPRLPLQSVPYAQRALTAAYAGQAASASYATTAGSSDGPWSTSGANVYRSSGNVGIGTASPTVPLHVYRSSGAVQAKIQSGGGDADLIIDNTSGNPTVEFHTNGTFKGSVGCDPVNNYVFLYHNGSLVFKNGRLGIGTNNPSASLEVRGDVKVTGQCQGTFPRPNYDSGWVPLSTSGGSQDGYALLTHALGGSVDDYVLDVVSRDSGGWGINNLHIGTYSSERGFFFANLTTNTVQIYRESEDTSSDEVRVRIWVYK